MYTQHVCDSDAGADPAGRNARGFVSACGGRGSSECGDEWERPRKQFFFECQLGNCAAFLNILAN